jgi:hypothetical protein
MVALDLAYHATEEPRNAADDQHRRLQGRVVAPPTCEFILRWWTADWFQSIAKVG